MPPPPNKKPEARFSINVVENDAGELLMLKRSPGAKLAPNRWGFPAGHIEQGESPEDCAVRELTEEIGSNFKVEPLRTVGPVRDTQYGGKYEIYLYHYRWRDGRITLNHEHTNYAWVGKEQFRDYDPMPGTDEDIVYLNIWPREYLREELLPAQ